MGHHIWNYYICETDVTISISKEGFIMSDTEKMEFLILYYNADKEVKASVEQILTKASQPSERQDQHSRKD